MLLTKPSFYLAIAGIVAMVMLVRKNAYQPPAPPPLVEPSRSPFKVSVAATGLIESARENVKIAAPRPGLIQKVYVLPGAKVRKGDPLLDMDKREAAAKVETMRAQLESMRAGLAMEQVQSADMKDQLDRVAKLEKDNVASIDEFQRKQFAFKTASARIEKTGADIKSAESTLRQSETELGVLSVTAPRDGTVLQVNIREGEYANNSSTEGLMLLGETEKLQVRAEVDEQNAPLVQPSQPAAAFLKGSTENKIDLRFIRIEPFVVPKRSLTGDSLERVDTRVLQIIFEFDRPTFPVYVGQQVDIFIRSDRSVRDTVPGSTQ